MIGLKEDAKEAQKKVDELMKIIRWLDDYRVFKVADPSSVERSIQNFYPLNLQRTWKRVKKDINAMNDALTKSPLRRLMAYLPPASTTTTAGSVYFPFIFGATARTTTPQGAA